jgi:hypothetical protein
MYTIDDCAEYVAFTAATAKGISTCCETSILYNKDNKIEVCSNCEAMVVAIVPF